MARRRIYLLVAILLGATFAIYAGSLHAPLVFDDVVFFEDPDLIAKYGHAYFSLDLRWLSYATFSWTTRWLGVDILWLRLGNVALHAANAVTLFFLLRRLFQATQDNGEISGEISAPLVWFAFFGALIFALHPISVYGAAYLIQRSILMATLFTLLMLLVYLEGLLRGGWPWMVGAALLYFAAVYSKEHSITAPGVALALTLLIRRPSLALLRQIAPYYILSSVVAIILLLSVKGMLGHAYEPNAAGILDISARKQGLTALPNIHLLSIFTQSGLFFKYLGLWLVPDPAWMSVDMREPFATGLLSWPYTLGMIAFLAYPCLALWLLLKRGSLGLLGFALLFPWIMYFTEFSTVRIQEPFVLYRSYLWMPGVFAALPVLLGRLSRRSAFILLCIVVLSLIPLTLNRLQTFSSTLNLWDDAEKLVRDKRNVFGAERIYYNRGTELGQLKRYREAVADFSTAIAIYPFDFIYGNRATAYYFLGEYQHALHDFDRAIELDPDNATSYYGRAMTYRVLGDFKAAQDDLRKSCSLGLCPQG
ncbi:MAG: tetratricopeptide repeat protein [Gallionella sp.]